MTSRDPARTTPRRVPRILVAGLLVVTTAAVAAGGHQLLASSAPARVTSTWVAASSAVARAPTSGLPPEPSEANEANGEADGAVPDGTMVFDDEVPGVANLDADLLGALRDAAMDADDDGVELFVNSGWRSPAYQDQLLRDAVSEYGSEEEAARWVATPETSAHVSGDAVDIGPSKAAAWLTDHGAGYGLCRIYDNEPWHFELRPDAKVHGCPARYADPTQDPRMHP